jgi:hypothetical protein
MTPSPAISFPSLAEIQEIVAMTDPVSRNLRITDGYYRLNRAMAAIVGSQDLSWCGFAVWASKTAGTYIRLENTQGIVDAWIARATAKAGPAATLLAHALRIHSDGSGQVRQDFSLYSFACQVLSAVGAAIAGGNQLVFGNIAPPFSALLTLWTTNGGVVPPAAKEQFLDSLRNAQLPAGYLFDAFSSTFDAAGAPGSDAAAQAMCYANALVGCVEQTAVQPYIVKSMNPPVSDMFFDDLEKELHCEFSDIIFNALKDALRPLAEALDSEFDRACTEWLMSLNLPDGSLRLGENVPALSDGQMYPAALATLNTPQPLGLMTSLDALNDANSAAQDWTSFPQRMRYIGVMFRSRQRDQSLWQAPFTAAQAEQIQSGAIPPGQL